MKKTSKLTQEDVARAFKIPSHLLDGIQQSLDLLQKESGDHFKKKAFKYLDSVAEDIKTESEFA